MLSIPHLPLQIHIFNGFISFLLRLLQVRNSSRIRNIAELKARQEEERLRREEERQRRERENLYQERQNANWVAPPHQQQQQQQLQQQQQQSQQRTRRRLARQCS